MKTAKQLARARRNPPLKQKRLELGLRAIDVSEELGIDQSYLSLLETGKRRPSLDTAMRLARFYACGVEDLFSNK